MKLETLSHKEFRTVGYENKEEMLIDLKEQVKLGWKSRGIKHGYWNYAVEYWKELSDN